MHVDTGKSIWFPMVLGVRYESREITERLFGELAGKSGGKKSRKYRNQARKRSLNLTRNRMPGILLLRRRVAEYYFGAKISIWLKERNHVVCIEFRMQWRPLLTICHPAASMPEQHQLPGPVV